MLRTTLVVLLSFLGCGIESTELTLSEDPRLAPQPAAPQPAATRPETEQISPQPISMRLDLPGVPSLVVPDQHTAPVALSVPVVPIGVHSLAVPDGTQVRFMVGMMGCGVRMLSEGTAVAYEGSFDIALTPEDPERPFFFGGLILFVQIGDVSSCDPATSEVYEVPVGEWGEVDLSGLSAITPAPCWAFDLR